MKKNAILVRTTKDSDRCEIIRKIFSIFSNFDYYFIEERYNEKDFITKLQSENHLIIGGDYLEKNNLEKINKTGWQCGDYILYAGLDYFPNYDFYWLVDDDLYFNLDVDVLINKTNNMDYECIAADYRKTTQDWFWYKTMSTEFDDVYGMLFCIVRFSRNAALFLKDKRSQYHPNLKREELNSLFANDESFTATYLVNYGFKCVKIEDVLPEFFSKNVFSLSSKPININELKYSYTQGQIIHPLCSDERFKIKVNSWVVNNKDSNFIPSLYRIYCNLGVNHASYLFSLDSEKKLKSYFKCENIANLYEIDQSLSQKKISGLKKKWFYSDICLVLDFEIKNMKFALDVEPDGGIYFVSRDNLSNRFIKNGFNSISSKVCLVSRINFTNKNIDNLILGDNLYFNILKVINFIAKKIFFFRIKCKIWK